jgi:hypothetical protein
MTYSLGDFSFIKDDSKRQYLKYDYNRINSFGEDAWKYLKDHKLNIPYDQDDKLKVIIDNLYPGHTSLTYKNSLTDLEYIAKNGWDNYVNSIIKINILKNNEKYFYIIFLIALSFLITVIGLGFR